MFGIVRYVGRQEEISNQGSLRELLRVRSMVRSKDNPHGSNGRVSELTDVSIYGKVPYLYTM